MERKDFIKTIIGISAMSGLSSFKNFAGNLKEQDEKMPVLFVGHGSPMNAIEENEFARAWVEMGRQLPKPKAILAVSAHWETMGTKVTAMDKPRTIYDFSGFPRELYEVTYPAPGSPDLVQTVRKVI